MTAALAATAFAVACTRDGTTGPREIDRTPTHLVLKALIASDGEDRIVEISVGYRRTDQSVRPLATDPSKVTIASGTTRQQPVVVDLVPCFSDRLRARGANGGCNLTVTLRLTDLAGTLIAVSTQDVPNVEAGGTAVVPGVELAAPTIALSAATLAFSGTTEFASPAPSVIQVTTAGSVPVGTLTSTITFGAGATGWLAATVNQATGAVTLTPTTGTLAPGTYTAVVSINGTTPGVKAQTITVTLVVRPVSVLTVVGAGSGDGRVTAAGVAPQTGIDCTIVAGRSSGTCTGRYPADADVSLQATPAALNSFGGWAGACTGTGACVVHLSAAATVTATFVAPPQTLTVNRSAGTGTGTVSANVGGIACTAGPTATTGSCATTQPFGTVVTLTAAPSTGSTFDGWTGDCTGNAACTVTLDRARNVAPTFTLTQQPLLITAGTGSGIGTITSNIGGITCALGPNSASGNCGTTLPYGTVITLTATAGTGSAFAGWSGACVGSGACTFTLDGARSASATFTLLQEPLTITGGTGSGGGTITSSVGGINCAVSPNAATGACSTSQPYGTVLSLSAAADATSVFSGWTGACSGNGTCTIGLDGAKQASAVFTLQTRTISVVAGSGDGSGRITSSPTGVDCSVIGSRSSGTCSTALTIGTLVTLTAAPNEGSIFTGWSGACSGTGPCSVTLGANTTVTATFQQQYRTLAVTVAGGGAGQVTSSPTGIDCTNSVNAAPANCSASFATGSAVTLTATAGIRSRFAGWSGACTGTGACTITLDQAAAVTATFSVIQLANVNVFVNGEGTIVFSPDGGQPPCVSTFSSASCTRAAEVGTVLTLTPQGVPADSSRGPSSFIGWGQGVCGNAGTGSCSFTVTGATNLSASFQRPARLSVSVVRGLGNVQNGRVTSSPAGIDCRLDPNNGNFGTCVADFVPGTQVTLTGAADLAGSQGRPVAGCDSGSPNGGPCTLTMYGNRSATMAIDGPASIAITQSVAPVPQGWQRQFDVTSDQSFRAINGLQSTVTQVTGDGSWTFERSLVGTSTATQLLTRCTFNFVVGSDIQFSGIPADFRVDVSSATDPVNPASQVITCSRGT